MTPYEVYVSCGERSEELATRFLDRFLPNRQEVAEEYPLPELSDNPAITFSDAASLLRCLEDERDEGYALYWNREDEGDPHQALLVFTEDGGMIAGLVSTHPDPSVLLHELAQFVGGEFGLVILEERPPETMEAFAQMCRNAEGIRLVEGELLAPNAPVPQF